MKYRVQQIFGNAILSISLLCSSAYCFAQSDVETAGSQGNVHLATLNWAKPDKFDTGLYSATAMHSSGLVVEVHVTESNSHNGLYYHIGQLNADTGTIQWGPSRLFISAGAWPAVAITPEGYVVITFSDGFYNCCSDLKYLTGTLDLNGGTSQLINFKTNKSGTRYDRGFHGSVSVNDIGVIAEAHESGNGGKGIFYRLGHLTNPSGGDYGITWDTGSNGVKYDDGVDPKISVNSDNNVIEVHGVSGESKLHYIRGKVATNGTQINFVSDHPRLESSGSRPSVVLLNNSSIIEVNRRSTGVVYRTGTLSGTNQVIWSEPSLIDDTKDRHYPSVSGNGRYVVGTFGDVWEYVNKSVPLFYTTAALP
jgi:hypothetical protein